MKKTTSIIYQIALGIYNIMPFKKQLCLFLKKINLPNKIFYKDLKFNGSFKVKIQNKQFKLIHFGGTIENEMFWNGIKSFENDTIWIWTELCAISSVVFDVGANTGVYSLIAKTLNSDSRVYAFEPSNHTFHKLQQNNILNKFDIVCEKIALSSNTGDQIFYDTIDHNQTSASLSAEKLKNWSGNSVEILEYNVKTMTMFDYIHSNNITSIDLIKIDIEMHEHEAIKGLGSYLQDFKPIVIIEVLSELVAAELNNLISSANYEIFNLNYF
jgi:FkbM family methyltransferase